MWPTQRGSIHGCSTNWAGTCRICPVKPLDICRGTDSEMVRKKRERHFLVVREGARPQDLARLVAEEDRNLDSYNVDPERYVDRALSHAAPAIFFTGSHCAASGHITSKQPSDLYPAAAEDHRRREYTLATVSNKRPMTITPHCEVVGTSMSGHASSMPLPSWSP